jgi:two-component system NtrC family response regulator
LALQPKLLRALESGEVQKVGSLDPRLADVHVIAATNRDLRSEVAAGRFRSDLFFRLGVVDIHLVPLRERREDIAYLTARFIREFAARLGRAITGVSAGAERLLQDAPWPGNIRELRNVLLHACILCEAGLLTERHLASALVSSPLADHPLPLPSASPLPTPSDNPPPDGRELLSGAQKRQIEHVLAETHGNKTEAARLLGVSRRSLYRWIDRLDLKS